jgi:hypothetical protein
MGGGAVRRFKSPLNALSTAPKLIAATARTKNSVRRMELPHCLRVLANNFTTLFSREQVYYGQQRVKIPGQ